MDHIVGHFMAVTFAVSVEVAALVAFDPGLTGQKAKNNTNVSHISVVYKKIISTIYS